MRPYSTLAIVPPPESALSRWFTGADLVDAYSTLLPPGREENIDVLAAELLGKPAPWFRALLALRDAAVRPLGIKTSGQMRTRQELGHERIDFFPVLSC